MTAAASAAGAVGAPNFAIGQTFGGKTFIKIFMRGGADGLHLAPRYGDPFYYQHRPNIAVPPPSADANSAINLGNGMRGLNPNLEPLMEIFDAGNMVVSPATALDSGNRSHFDNQRWIGTGARNNLLEGYLNRYLQNVDGMDSALRGVVAGKTSVSTEMTGNVVIPAIASQPSFTLENRDFCSGSGCADNQLTERLAEVASAQNGATDLENSIRDQYASMIESIGAVEAAAADYTPSAGGLDYTNSDIGRGLRLIAQMLKGGIPLEVAAVDFNIGWDTHSNQISDAADRFVDQDKSYHRRMREGATNLVTFYRDMGPAMQDIVILVCTEFGRTVIENGSVGTDHGHGGTWFAIGGGMQSAVAPDVASLDTSDLLNERYIPTVVDYRDIVGEIMVKHMSMNPGLVSTVFPGHSFTDPGFIGGLT